MAADPTLQPIGWKPDLDEVTRARIELGTSPLQIAAEIVEDVHTQLREAMKLTDCTEHRDLHLRLGNEINDLDDVVALLMERCS